MVTPPDPTIAALAAALHRRYCGEACPPRSELHVNDRQWLADARAIAGELTRDEKRRYRLAVMLDYRSEPLPEYADDEYNGRVPSR